MSASPDDIPSPSQTTYNPSLSEYSSDESPENQLLEEANQVEYHPDKLDLPPLDYVLGLIDNMAPAETRSQAGSSKPKEEVKETIEVTNKGKGKAQDDGRDDEDDITILKRSMRQAHQAYQGLEDEMIALQNKLTKLERKRDDDEEPDPRPVRRDTTVPLPSDKGFRPSPPPKYDGTTDVEDWLSAAKLYLAFFRISLSEDEHKVLAVCQHLEGDALAWLQPILDNHLDMTQEELEESKYVFSKYENFEDRMRLMFGNPLPYQVWFPCCWFVTLF
ncbi:uncharacterized protein F4812DRAFT_218361 [Daldinia caldariorum]|uniref:uncharacterized protein n=1 Tax=Daldinia caldariorum TaxID=326644 RepID=UPI0020076988|nr:uncharacterized protein F4812DRAFT_218361 [Daldinia caldariorum]KAI1463981.1 hypothetical protein F4812DRAFT_218361 [Daldinia caldariorum]